MVSAVVLIRTQVAAVAEVARSLLRLEGVTQVLSVAGNYDLVALVSVRENEQLADLVGDGIRKIAGVTATETLIAFRVYKPEDLQSGYDLGITD